MGTILKTKLFLKYLAPSSSLTKYSRTPYIIKEAFDSPGWTLEVRIMAFRFAISSAREAKFVIIAISQSLPAIVLQIDVFLILSLVSGVQIFCKNSQQSE